jgi:hypothetical protein
MTDTAPGGPGAAETARRMRDIAAGLQAAGLTAHLHDTSGVLDITATAHRPGSKEMAVVVDDDGYVEVRYWNHPGATPEHITAVIVRALAAITTAQRT